MSRRVKIEIINDMLVSMLENGGKIKPTHLLYKSNLSHSKMKQYINELESKGMIEELNDRGHKFFSITDKGVWFINEFKRIKEFSDAFGL